MIVLVDVDSTIADLMPEWLRLYNNDYSDTLTPDKITDWDMTKFVHPDCGTKIFSYLLRDDLYDNVKPIDGAVSSIRWLRQRGHDVRFVTSGVQPAKIQWLGNLGMLIGEHFMFSPDIIIAHDKSIIKGDIMIDDNPKNLETFHRKKVLFAQPWNDGGYSPYVFRADNWPDVIQHLAKERVEF